MFGTFGWWSLSRFASGSADVMTSFAVWSIFRRQRDMARCHDFTLRRFLRRHLLLFCRCDVRASFWVWNGNSRGVGVTWVTCYARHFHSKTLTKLRQKNTTSQLRKSLKISCGCALFFTFNAMNSTVGGELFFQALIFYKKDATGLPLWLESLHIFYNLSPLLDTVTSNVKAKDDFKERYFF